MVYENLESSEISENSESEKLLSSDAYDTQHFVLHICFAKMIFMQDGFFLRKFGVTYVSIESFITEFSIQWTRYKKYRNFWKQKY